MYSHISLITFSNFFLQMFCIIPYNLHTPTLSACVQECYINIEEHVLTWHFCWIFVLWVTMDCFMVFTLWCIVTAIFLFLSVLHWNLNFLLLTFDKECSQKVLKYSLTQVNCEILTLWVMVTWFIVFTLWHSATAIFLVFCLLCIGIWVSCFLLNQLYCLQYDFYEKSIVLLLQLSYA